MARVFPGRISQRVGDRLLGAAKGCKNKFWGGNRVEMHRHICHISEGSGTFFSENRLLAILFVQASVLYAQRKLSSTYNFEMSRWIWSSNCMIAFPCSTPGMFGTKATLLITPHKD